MVSRVVSAMKFAMVQLSVGVSKADNLSRAARLISEAAKKGADIVSLPECFNSPYGTKFFSEYSETIPGDSTEMLAKVAKEHKIHVIGGSIPEKADGMLYNTCTVFDPEGGLIAKHRKIHLFDIDVPGKIRFQESEVLSPGNQLTVFDTPFCKIGIGVCYDMRFAELGQIYAQKGCQLLVYPGAFNMTTGPAHWELIQRARAVDNQLYVATVSPARDECASYVAWGHSTLVNPWGEVICKLGHGEDTGIAEIDFGYVNDVREQIPIRKQKRDDLYLVKCLD